MANIGHMAALTLAAAAGVAMSPLQPAGARHYEEPEPYAKNPPDRLSADIHSPFHDKCASNVDVFFNGMKMPNNVQEYCVSEGWLDVRQRNGKGRFMLDTHGNHIVKREYGKVEPVWRRKPTAPMSEQELQRLREARAASSERTQSAAEAKRARKLAKAAALAARNAT